MVWGRLILVATVLLVAGCGFHLRGMGENSFSIEEIAVTSANAHGELEQSLKQTLRDAGTSVVPTTEAPYTLRLLEDQTERRSVSTTGQISVSEYQLTMRVAFELGAPGEVVIPSTNIFVERIYRFDNESLVGSGEEELILREEMRREIVSRIVLRVDAAIKQHRMRSGM